MLLLQFLDTGKIVLTKELVGDDPIPPYAILSHTWKEDHEVSFDNIKNDTGLEKSGYDKIRFCGKQAAHDGLQYFWVDTCCIDKSSSSELSEAINSMFRWYKGAEKCYVYLFDVSVGCSVEDEGISLGWEMAFKKSRWFTRGWTPQELLAPKSVEFFSQEGKKLGDRKSLEGSVSGITEIPIAALRGSPLSCFTVDERFSWTAKRSTKREEDMAYSLLGIFGVHMCLLYGEGRQSAFKRLRHMIDEPLPHLKRDLKRQVLRLKKVEHAQKIILH